MPKRSVRSRKVIRTFRRARAARPCETSSAFRPGVETMSGNHGTVGPVFRAIGADIVATRLLDPCLHGSSGLEERAGADDVSLSLGARAVFLPATSSPA